MTMDYYRGMLTQGSRIAAFRRRISEIVRPGDRVLEIGSGLGTYAFFAADAGAAKVWAVEGAPIVNVARALARHNDYAGRVEFIRGWFPGLTIPEPADVLIFENFPARLMDQWTYDLLRQVHAEALRPGARVVADRARLFLVPVECPRNWRIVGAFGGDHDTAYGLDWSPTRPYIYNSPLHMPLEPANFRHEPRAVADVDFSRFPPGGSLAGEAQWVFDHPATIHGLGFWFDLGLGDVWLSNEPGREPGSWGYVYLPIAEPVTVSSGSSLVGAVRPELSTDGAPVWLTWEVAAGNQRFRGHEFRSHPASLADLIPGSPQWVPEMSHQTRVELEVLKLVDGVRTVEEIARELVGMGVAETVDLARMIVLAALEGRTTVSPRAARTLNV